MDRDLLFRKLLYRLGESLSRQDLDSLNFMCQDVVSVARMERVQSCSDLWQALTERNKLSKIDLSYLALLMSSIGKENLLGELQTHGFSILAPVKGAECLFLESLLKIAQNLSSTEIKDLTYMFDEVNSDKVFSATQLFQMLLQRQIISPTNMQRLCQTLVLIGRSDLTNYISHYLPPPSRNAEPQMQATHRNQSVPYQDPSLSMDVPSLSSGVSSCVQGPFPPIFSQESLSDYPDGGHIFSEEAQHGGHHCVATTENKTACLWHSLALKERVLSCKQEEIEDLQRHLTEQALLEERLVQEHKGDCHAYYTNIQKVQDLLMAKNQEVASLMDELQRYNQQMGFIQSSSPVQVEDFYLLDKQPHGYCLIFNNYKFSHPHQIREGSSIDQGDLIRTFKFLQYHVVVKENLTADQMQDTIIEFANMDHTNFDSFVCCVLTHGEADVVHGIHGRELNLQKFASWVKLCPSLREKPKIFFVQACRGDKERKGLEIQKDAAGHEPSGNQAPPTITATIPQDTDFFFGFATPLGSAAYRSKKYGSWYISSLCEVLCKYAHTDNLSSMMKKVNNKVACADTNRGFKQCAEYVDRLRKKVHFFLFLEKH